LTKKDKVHVAPLGQSPPPFFDKKRQSRLLRKGGAVWITKSNVQAMEKSGQKYFLKNNKN
jgi:hypothetical protein